MWWSLRSTGEEEDEVVVVVRVMGNPRVKGRWEGRKESIWWLESVAEGDGEWLSLSILHSAPPTRRRPSLYAKRHGDEIGRAHV